MCKYMFEDCGWMIILLVVVCAQPCRETLIPDACDAFCKMDENR